MANLAIRNSLATMQGSAMNIRTSKYIAGTGGRYNGEAFELGTHNMVAELVGVSVAYGTMVETIVRSVHRQRREEEGARSDDKSPMPACTISATDAQQPRNGYNGTKESGHEKRGQ